MAQVSTSNTFIYFASKPIYKYIAYKIFDFNVQSTIEFSPVSRTSTSPVFSEDGEPWEWIVSNVKIDKAEMPSLWLCIPSSWRLEPMDDLHARIFIKKRLVGSINIKLATEGFWVSIEKHGRIEKVYYYLGYDLSPEEQ